MPNASLDVALVAQDQRLRRSVYLAGLVVVLYDHLLTLGSEIRHIWVRPVKRSSIWFLTVRYVAVLSNLGMMAFFMGDFGPEETLVGCTLALRVYAIYGFNRRVLVSLVIVAVTAVSLGIWAVLRSEITLETTPPSCSATMSKPRAIRKSRQCTAAAWEAQLACDILILCLTLWRAVTYHRSVGLGSGSLLATMGITADSLTWFASAISMTMISRLMLNLHDAVNGSFSLTSTAQYGRPAHELSSIRFRTPGSRRPNGHETHELSLANDQSSV
ncbi:hypothetical protein B0H11DRAFT_2225055 [Mycena galericulata]|nr:hypothetical protein B0H11DRAFT_2225055 [Mycena galericulata]